MYLSVLGVTPFLVRVIGVRTNATCVQLLIPYSCVLLSPAHYNGAFVGTLEDARITPAFNSVLLLKIC